MSDARNHIQELRELHQRQAALAQERTELRRAVENKILERFGERVKWARAQAQLTQQQLADEVDMSRASIANIEAGRQDIPTTTLVMLAAALELPPSALID